MARAMTLRTARCDAGRAPDCAEMALYLVGEPNLGGIPRDADRASRIAKRLCDEVGPQWCGTYGHVIWFGGGKSSTFVPLLRQGCEAGNRDACASYQTWQKPGTSEHAWAAQRICELGGSCS